MRDERYVAFGALYMLKRVVIAFYLGYSTTAGSMA